MRGRALREFLSISQYSSPSPCTKTRIVDPPITTPQDAGGDYGSGFLAQQTMLARSARGTCVLCLLVEKHTESKRKTRGGVWVLGDIRLDAKTEAKAQEVDTLFEIQRAERPSLRTGTPPRAGTRPATAAYTCIPESTPTEEA